MRSKTKSKRRRSIGEWCQDLWSNIDKQSYALGKFIYNREHQEILGRDGRRWSKLAAFYFFFYIALGGFFCLYLSIYMSLLPLNQPRYIGKTSCFKSRANPLSPGLSFRPQPKFHPNDMHALISLSSPSGRHGKRSINDDLEMYIKNLDEFLDVHYSTSHSKNFTMSDVGDCNSKNQYGFQSGKPCFLIKMNKIVGFVPEIGRRDTDNKPELACTGISNIPVKCLGEHSSDQSALGSVRYYSESGSSDVCGSIDVKHFPYQGKEARKDVYQAPYVWVQFTDIKPNTLISVECRIFGANLFYHKIAQRSSVRFQLYLNKNL